MIDDVLVGKVENIKPKLHIHAFLRNLNLKILIRQVFDLAFLAANILECLMTKTIPRRNVRKSSETQSNLTLMNECVQKRMSPLVRLALAEVDILFRQRIEDDVVNRRTIVIEYPVKVAFLARIIVSNVTMAIGQQFIRPLFGILGPPNNARAFPVESSVNKYCRRHIIILS